MFGSGGAGTFEATDSPTRVLIVPLGREVSEIERLRIGKVRADDIAQRAADRFEPSGMFLSPNPPASA